MKDIIQDKFKHYFIVSILGMFAGGLVWFFSQFPTDDLWAFSLFSSMTLGFWMFTCSLIVLFSKSKKVASLSVILYVYFMYFFTGVGKITRLVNNGNNTWNFNNIFFDIILYGVIPSILCGISAIVLHNAKKRNIFGNILLFLPGIYIIVEAIYMIVQVITKQTNLFMCIVEVVCAILYFYILRKDFIAIFKKENKIN